MSGRPPARPWALLGPIGRSAPTLLAPPLGPLTPCRALMALLGPWVSMALSGPKRNTISYHVMSYCYYYPCDFQHYYYEYDCYDEDYCYIITNNISEVNKNYDNKYNIPKKFIKDDELFIHGAQLYKVYKKPAIWLNMI